MFPTHLTKIINTTILITLAAMTTHTRAQSLIATPAPEWTALFDRTHGWTGADGIYSIPLNGMETPPDNNNTTTLFIFSDTFVGEVDKNDHRVPGFALVNNTAALLRGTQPDPSKIKFIVAHDKNGKPRALVIPNTPHSNKDNWYWFFDGVVDGNKLYIFLERMKRGNGGSFNFVIDGVSLLILDLNNPQAGITQIETPLFLPATTEHGEITFGGGIMPNTKQAHAPHPDGYIYIYGTQNDQPVKKLVAARVRPGHLADFNQYQYYDGSKWTHNIQKTATLTPRISPELSVTPLPDGRYILVYQEDTIGRFVDVRFGQSPVGPWDYRKQIYQTPEPDQLEGVYTYNAKAHPSLSAPGELLISYNVNTFNGTDHFTHAEIYHPRFIRLKLK